MPDINFLSGGNNKKKESEGRQDKVSWTKPIKDEPSSAKQVEDIFDNSAKPAEVKKKSKTSGLFSFVKKKDDVGLSGEKVSKDDKKKKEMERLMDKDNIKKSRKDMLRMIEGGKSEKETPKEKTLKKSKKEKKKEHDDKKTEAPKSFFDKLSDFWNSLLGRGPVRKDLKSEKSVINGQSKGDADKADKKQDSQIWEETGVIETNLIKGEVTSYFDWKRGFVFFTISLVFVFLFIFGSYQGLIMWGENEKREAIEISSKVEDLNKKIEPLEKEARDIALVQKRIKMVSELLKNHIYWTNFFEFLENNTVPDVYYESFSGDIGGGYGLSATGRSFKTVTHQVIAMRKNDLVNGVGVSNVSFSSVDEEGEGDGEGEEETEKGTEAAGVGFQFNFSIDTNIFKK